MSTENKIIDPFEVRTWLIQNQEYFFWDENGNIEKRLSLLMRLSITLITFIFVIPAFLIRTFGFPLIIIGIIFFFMPTDLGRWLTIIYTSITGVALVGSIGSVFLSSKFPDPIFDTENYKLYIYDYLTKSIHKKDSYTKSYKKILRRTKMFTKSSYNQNWRKISFCLTIIAQNIILLKILPWNLGNITFKETILSIWGIMKYELIIFLNTVTLGISEYWSSAYITKPTDVFTIILFEVLRIFLVIAFIEASLTLVRNLFHKPIILVKDNIFGLNQFLKEHRFGERGITGVKRILIYDFGSPIDNQWSSKKAFHRDDILEIEKQAINSILEID